MSKHNYSQYSNKKNKNPDDVSVNVTKVPLVPIDLIPEESDVAEVKMVVEPVETDAVCEPVEPVETVTLPETVKGIVANCARLNVRAYPSPEADIVCVLDVMSEVIIDPNKSTYDWLCVCTATGIEGYCMKKFVDSSL